MSFIRRSPEFVTLILIVLAGLVDAAIYGGVVRGEDAGPRPEVNFELPPGNAPGVEPSLRPHERAELDDSPDLPGRFVPSEGKRHTGAYPLRENQRIEFCPDDGLGDDCYESNPPTSGWHLPVQRNVLLEDGHRVNLPPDPGVYDFEVPRESIPHIQEHAGVFLGYNCQAAPGGPPSAGAAADAVTSCAAAVAAAGALVRQQLALGERVVMAPDADLPADTIALASWTRIDAFPAAEYSDARALAFIDAHSCRYDPEEFCARGQEL